MSDAGNGGDVASGVVQRRAFKNAGLEPQRSTETSGAPSIGGRSDTSPPPTNRGGSAEWCATCKLNVMPVGVSNTNAVVRKWRCPYCNSRLP